MKKVLFLTFYKSIYYGIALLGLFFLLVSCTLEPQEIPVCQDGSCDAVFRIDTQINPGSFQDSNGVWHIKYSGNNYFTIKGVADQLNSENIVNGTPLIETGFDSDFFFTPENIQWTYPVYSFLGLFTNNTLTTAIPYGYQTLTLPQILNNTSVTNIVGYEMTSRTSFDKPYSPTLLSVYSKYNYVPQRNIIFLQSFIGEEATIHIRVIWGEAHSETKYYTLRVKFEN
jgi:hypothetical protein